MMIWSWKMPKCGKQKATTTRWLWKWKSFVLSHQVIFDLTPILHDDRKFHQLWRVEIALLTKNYHHWKMVNNNGKVLWGWKFIFLIGSQLIHFLSTFYFHCPCIHKRILLWMILLQCRPRFHIVSAGLAMMEKHKTSNESWNNHHSSVLSVIISFCGERFRFCAPETSYITLDRTSKFKNGWNYQTLLPQIEEWSEVLCFVCTAQNRPWVHRYWNNSTEGAVCKVERNVHLMILFVVDKHYNRRYIEMRLT